MSLSASPSSGGSVSGSGGYDAGSKATVSCAAASGWRFVRWSDGGYQTHSVTMDGNKSLTAYFERYTVTGDEIFSGVALTSGSYWNAYGNASVVSVGGGTASVRFNGWSGESNYVMFDRGYMGGKLEQGHKYRMTLSMKASISSASLIGFIGSSFADYVSEDVLFYGSYNGGGIINLLQDPDRRVHGEKGQHGQRRIHIRHGRGLHGKCQQHIIKGSIT